MFCRIEYNVCMNQIVLNSSVGTPPSLQSKDTSQVKKWALIALSTILALGMIFSYMVGGPWLLTFFFFACALVPLLPLHKVIQAQNQPPLYTNNLKNRFLPASDSH